MSAAAIVIIVVVVAAVVLLVAMVTVSRRRRLKRRFGPEYDRVVDQMQSHRKAEAELASRERRIQSLDIRPLDATARVKYAAEWTAVQERFVDQPRQAVAEAQRLVVAVMQERGYPTEDPGQMATDLSVEHARTLEHYRAAREISTAAETDGTNGPSTEDLRQAMVHYRALFSDLLGPADQAAPAAAPAPADTRARQTGIGQVGDSQVRSGETGDGEAGGEDLRPATPQAGHDPASPAAVDPLGSEAAPRTGRR